MSKYNASWLIVAGSVASVLTIIATEHVYTAGFFGDWYSSGLIFAVLITAAMAALNRGSRWGSSQIFRYCVAALVIALGPPCGFLVFAGVARILEAIMGKSPNAIHAIPIPVIAMGCAVFFWAFLLNIFLRLTFLSWNLLWFMQAAVLLLLLFGFAYGIDSATKALWGKSIFVPVFIAAEQIGAAAFLAARSASLAGGARTRNG